MPKIAAALTAVVLVGVAVSARQDQPAFALRLVSETGRPVALRHVRVIDGTGASPRDDQTLVVVDGRIRAVGPMRDVAVPDGADVLDLAGYTVLPGLVMLHEHLQYGGGPDRVPFRDQPFSVPRLFLAFGVTTIRLAAGPGNPYVSLNLKRAVAAGEVDGPEMFVSAGLIAANPVNGGHLLRMGAKLVQDSEDVRRHVRHWAAEGVSSIKVHEPITAWALAAAVEEAHKHRLPVLGHLGPVTCLEAARLGIDFIEHGFDMCEDDLRVGGEIIRDPTAPKARELFQALLATKVTMTETPITDEPLTALELNVLHPSAREYYERSQLRQKQAVRTSASPVVARPGLAVAYVQEGGRVVVGSDAGGVPRIPGFANHKSVRLLQDELGFSQLEAIRIATLNGASALGIADRTGTIAVGKEADLLVVRGDPAQSLVDLSNAAMVFSNGKRFDPKALLSEVAGQFGWR